MADQTETNEIEMNNLLGHSDDKIVSTAERGGWSNDNTGHRAKSRKRSTPSTLRVSYPILFLIVFAVGTIVFVIDRVYLAHEGLLRNPLLEDERTQTFKGSENEMVDKSSEKGSNCADDPLFQFRNNPKLNCDWAAQNHGRVCDKNHKNGLIRDSCPFACGDCLTETQIKGTYNDDSRNSTGNFDMEDEHKGSKEPKTIIDGIDDKDVFCEDLSKYNEWHKTKVTKNDGIMYRVVQQMNHDANSFTQGLTYARGKLFESAGLYGKSTVRILDGKIPSKIEMKVSMDAGLFAEGMTYYKDTLVQITWKSQRGFIYNMTNLEKIDSFDFETTLNEGWGITWDRCKDELIVTDGSPNLHFWDPNTMKEKRRVSVRRMDGSEAKELNEIEFWRGRVLANVWFQDVILVINPESGVVEKEYDFSKLWPRNERKKKSANVLNGISISENPNFLYFTGKLWDRMYSIELLPEL